MVTGISINLESYMDYFYDMNRDTEKMLGKAALRYTATREELLDGLKKLGVEAAKIGGSDEDVLLRFKPELFQSKKVQDVLSDFLYT